MTGTSHRTIDANLLLTLQALLEERNLTRAGERLLVTQPAMTHALTKLRRHFGDELLVRVGREYELTPLARQLLPRVTVAVQAAERVLGGSTEFDPRTTNRAYLVSLTEYAATVLAGPLVRRLADKAPHSSVEFTPIATDPAGLCQDLLRRDLIIGPGGFGIPGEAQPVFTDDFVCVAADDNPRVRDGMLTLDDLQELPHAVARFSHGNSTMTPDQIALETAGVHRRAAVTVASLLALPLAIAGTNLVGFVPARLLRRCGPDLRLVCVQTPLPAIPLVESAHWHPTRSRDPALSWLRSLLFDVAVAVEDDKLRAY